MSKTKTFMPINHIEHKALTPKERAILFKTRVISVQLQRFIEAKGSVTSKMLSDAFPEISGRVMYDRIRNLLDRGIVERKDGAFVPTYAVDPKGTKSDCAWRAARLLAAASFTPDQLAALANIDREHAATLCRLWRDKGLLVKIGQKGKRIPLYKMISNEVIRPVFKQERRDTNG